MSLRLDHKIGLIVHRTLVGPFFQKPKTLMLFGTMRSGSTLVSNVLLSCNEITGFGESHLTYDSPRRLLDLRYWAFRYTHRYPRGNRYLFDKVLHNSYVPDVNMLMTQSDAHVLLLLRAPGNTADSIRKMVLKLRPERLEHTDIWALLTERYAALEQMLREMPEDTPVAALRYEALLAEPDAVLNQLSGFLNLRTPLCSDYEIPRWGGRWGLGDGSAKLRSGTIEVRPRTLDDTLAKTVPESVTDAFDSLCDQAKIRANIAWL